MDTLFLFVIVAGFGAIGFLVWQQQQKLTALQEPKDDQSQQLMLETIKGLRQELNDTRRELTHAQQETDKKVMGTLKHNQDALQKQFESSSKIIGQVTEKLTSLDKTNEQVVGFAQQLHSLENVLKNPKGRGVLGEYFLESLLANVLQPGQYQMQYKMKNGEIVDAVVFMRGKVIPVDAKFSLAAYNKMMETEDDTRRAELEREFKNDIKKRIDETAKYIRPEEENTTDFALMFVPAEGIYYNMLIYNVGAANINASDLIEYAFKKRVIIVSPTSFFAYLQTVLQGLKALQMEESVKDIVKKVGELGRHISTYEDYFGKVGKHLSTTVNAYNAAGKELGKIDKDVTKISGDSPNLNIEVIDTPRSED